MCLSIGGVDNLFINFRSVELNNLLIIKGWK